MNCEYNDLEDAPNGETVNRKIVENKSCTSGCFGLIGLLLSSLWLLNLGCGIFEIPDCLPIIGNLDEVFFTIIFLASLSALGIKIPLLSKLISRNNHFNE